MTTILPKEENIDLTLNGSTRKESPGQKNFLPSKQLSRDSLCMINERNAIGTHQSIEQEDDSETENLSPLLKFETNHSKSVLGLVNIKLASSPIDTQASTTVEFEQQRQKVSNSLQKY